MRVGGGEHIAQDSQERLVRRVIGSKCENTAGVKLNGKRPYPFGLVEIGVASGQKVARRMIDVEQDGAELPP